MQGDRLVMGIVGLMWTGTEQDGVQCHSVYDAGQDCRPFL